MRIRAGIVTVTTLVALSAGVEARAQAGPGPAPATPDAETDELLDDAYEDGRDDAALDLVDELLPDGRTSGDYKALGDAAARRGRSALASTWYLISARVDPKNDLAAYRLAVTLASTEQRAELVLRWLGRAVDAGFWGATELDQERAFEPYRATPRFAELARRVRERAVEGARSFLAAPVVVAPSAPPSAATAPPVLVLLHGRGESPAAMREEATAVAKLGWLAIAVPGTVVRAADSLAWDEASAEVTHRAVQSALTALERGGARLDRRRVVTFGLGQGAAHAARLVGEHPADYVGGILVGLVGRPGAVAPLEPERARPLFAVVGQKDDPSGVTAVSALRDAWARARLPWREHAHAGHDLPADWDDVRPVALRWALSPR